MMSQVDGHLVSELSVTQTGVHMLIAVSSTFTMKWQVVGRKSAAMLLIVSPADCSCRVGHFARRRAVGRRSSWVVCGDVVTTAAFRDLPPVGGEIG